MTEISPTDTNDGEPSLIRVAYAKYGLAAAIGAAIGLFIARYRDTDTVQTDIDDHE